MPDRVKGKVALVTGGASGIGRACALLLGSEGAVVVVSDIQDDAGKDCAAKIKKSGSDAVYLHHDVAREEDWTAIVAETKARFGRLDVLVNNAGIAIAGPITEMSLADWRRQESINLDGVFLGVKHALPLMRAGGGGSIVNISSLAGLKGSANLAGYCATKGGVRLFTKAVAMECAQARDNVRVNSVHPGFVDTPMARPGLLGNESGKARMDATPLGRFGKPIDIAMGCLYLASDESSWVTGSELVIDGGLTAN